MERTRALECFLSERQEGGTKNNQNNRNFQRKAPVKESWHLPVEQIIHLFKEADVLGYIEKCYGIFHCEGDEAVLEDITEFLKGKGIEISA